MGAFARLTRATRRRLLVCAATALIALPVEATLLASMRSPDSAAAAWDWAASLSHDDLQDAAQRIQDYPYFYRRAIMTALEPDERAQTWRRFLTSYSATHQLDQTSRLLISRAIAAMTPEVFDNGAPPEQLAELASVFDIAVGVFGRRSAVDLFMRLGPDDGSMDSTNALPFAERMSARLREWLSVHAASADCDCTTAFGISCDAAGPVTADVCASASGCEPDVSWPMCGVAWSYPCNGVCTAIQPLRP